jgi:hypothetical protein
MNSRQLAQVGLGLIGVWALLDALRVFSGIASMGDEGPRGAGLLVVGVTLALFLGLSYVLVFRSAQLAATIAPDVGATNEHGPQDLARILIALLGVLLLAQAAPLTINAVLGFLAAGEYPDAWYRPGPLRSFIDSCVQLAIALFLIMRPQRLLEFVRRPVATTDQ